MDDERIRVYDPASGRGELISGGQYPCMMLVCGRCTRRLFIHYAWSGGGTIKSDTVQDAAAKELWTSTGRGRKKIWYCPTHRATKRPRRDGLVQHTLI